MRFCLDVKTGAGAFMKTEEDSIELAHAMVKIWQSCWTSRPLPLFLICPSRLDLQLGMRLEVKEAIDTLRGNGPEDLTELVLTLAGQMVMLAKKADSVEEARKRLLKEVDPKWKGD